MATAKRNEEATLNYLRTVATAGESKYMRNGRKWYNSADWSPANNTTLTPLGWIFQDYSAIDDTGTTPKVNVSKSVIDTYVSKIANQKVIPLFTPRKGSFITRKVIKQVQHYFDDLFYKNDVNEKVAEAERFGAIFDIGWTFCDTWTKTVKSLAPWNVGIVKNEWQYTGKGSKALIQFKNFPTTMLPEYGLKDDNKTFCLFEIFYDVENKVTKLFKDEKQVDSRKWNGTRVPLRPHYFNAPLLGFRTSSLFDDLLPIQQQIDINITKIKDATMSTPMNTMFVPDGTEVDLTQLSAGAGNMVRYRATPGVTGDPVHVAAPVPVDDFYIRWHEQLKNDAYQMAGVSELSAQSEKPDGLDSGEALKTMENIESARFETQLSRCIHAYVDLANIFIDSFDENEEVLPKQDLRDEITWKDVKKQINDINIQFTAASALTNDPQKQVQLLKELSQLGLIDQSRVAEMIDLPDSESAFDDTSSLPDAVDMVIQKAINGKDEEERYKIPIFVDYEVLRDRIVLYQNKFFAMNGSHEEEIGALQKLYLKLEPLIAEIDAESASAEMGEEGAQVADPSKGFAVAEGLNPGGLTQDSGNPSGQMELSTPGQGLDTGNATPADMGGAI
jgi:hypothetical protein